MRVDLHNHTTRCNHAEGTIDEYLETAIERGIDAFGFSCHAPMEFNPEFRMALSEMRDYESDVLLAKERFKGRIDVLLGYEVDFLENYMLDEVLNANCDYLIGSVHFLNGWGFDNPESIFEYVRKDIDDIWFGYFLAIEQLAKCGKFDIVGHMDIIKIFNYYPKGDIRTFVEKALRAIKQSNMVIEINASGLRKPVGEQYPSREILELAYSMSIPITFGSDAHKPDHVAESRLQMETLAREIGYSQCAMFNKRDRYFIDF